MTADEMRVTIEGRRDEALEEKRKHQSASMRWSIQVGRIEAFEEALGLLERLSND